MKSVLFIFLFFSINTWATPICERSHTSTMVEFLKESTSRMSFKNRGGLMNGGVCWWHSRFQRAAAYLVEFRPDLDAPADHEIPQLLKEIKSMSSVITIPGFNNFFDFTQRYQPKIQSLLEAWQREDGFINQQWLRGISGKYELEPAAMRDRMNTLYDQFKRSMKPVWIMAQIKGIESHSFLLVDMQQTNDGYELLVIDSNFPLENKVISYHVGQKNLKHPKDKYSFVPYLGFQKDFISIERGVSHFCQRSSWDGATMPVGEIEL